MTYPEVLQKRKETIKTAILMGLPLERLREEMQMANGTFWNCVKKARGEMNYKFKSMAEKEAVLWFERNERLIQEVWRDAKNESDKRTKALLYKVLQGYLNDRIEKLMGLGILTRAPIRAEISEKKTFLQIIGLVEERLQREKAEKQRDMMPQEK